MAATDDGTRRKSVATWATALLVQALPVMARAAVLPDDRADAMYHRYQGGGVTVDGPALLVRKDMADTVSLYADYYVDSVSSASIDVMTTASPYKEKRTEKTLGFDFLYRDAVLGAAVTRSDEPDYRASTVSLRYAQEVFGGMTTVNMGYAVGRDTVLSKIEPNFSDSVHRYSWRLGVSQILTGTWLVSLDYEGISEDGYLNSPYRAARVLNVPVPERYPRERSTHAVAFTSLTQVFSRSALKLHYRYFTDNWGVNADTLEGTFSRYVGEHWLLDFRLRGYSQTKASFYADNFRQQMTYMARDKELSTFKSTTYGATATYKLFERRYGIDRASLIGSYDYVQFRYQDFTDVRTGKPYAFDANVYQLIFSAWY